MTSIELICLGALVLGLAGLAGYVLRRAYLRANPKPRPPFTDWRSGRTDR